MRYSPNQKSRFEDEQDGQVVREPVDFVDGFLRVPKNNPVLQEFLYYHPLNGKKFIEVNEEKDAAAEIEQLNIEADALIEARKLYCRPGRNHDARVLLGRNTEQMSTAELQ